MWSPWFSFLLVQLLREWMDFMASAGKDPRMWWRMGRTGYSPWGGRPELRTITTQNCVGRAELMPVSWGFRVVSRCLVLRAKLGHGSIPDHHVGRQRREYGPWEGKIFWGGKEVGRIMVLWDRKLIEFGGPTLRKKSTHKIIHFSKCYKAQDSSLELFVKSPGKWGKWSTSFVNFKVHPPLSCSGVQARAPDSREWRYRSGNMQEPNQNHSGLINKC